jgi:hypothetical protein
MNLTNLSLRLSSATAALLLCGMTVAFAPTASAAEPNNTATNRDAIGSWFGRAVPVPGKTICQPGSPGCTVPPEVLMVFTIHADGTMVAMDSNFFAASHTTAHGQWYFTGPTKIRAAFSFMQSGADGKFMGSFTNQFEATVVDPDRMEGVIDAYLYAYVGRNGLATVDADGFPTPNPLSPSQACATTPGCVALGQFSFKIRRIAPPQPSGQ